MNPQPKSRACLALFITALAFCSAACGSDDSGFTNANANANQPVVSSQANPFAARYLGTGALSNGQTGDLDMTVDAQGNVSGTFTVVNAPVSALADFSVVAGSYPVSGTVDTNTGAFTLAGSVPDLGNFSITGLLPLDGGHGQYVVSLNAQSFSGIVQASPLGSSAPESGRTRSIVSGNVISFNFQANGYNGVNPPIGNNPVFGGLYTTGTYDSNTLTIALTQPGTDPGNFRLLSFGVNTHGNPIKLGTYPLVTNPSSNGAFLNLTDTTGPNLNAAWSPSSNSSGSITLNIITSTQADVDYNFQNVGPNPRSPGSAQGSFNVNGHVRVNFSN